MGEEARSSLRITSADLGRLRSYIESGSHHIRTIQGKGQVPGKQNWQRGYKSSQNSSTIYVKSKNRFVWEDGFYFRKFKWDE